MTTARDWPNNHKESRDRAAECAVAVMAAVKPLTTRKPLSDEERIANANAAYSTAMRIAWMMTQAGSKAIDPAKLEV